MLLTLVSAIAACSPPLALPADARAALVAYWEGLPSDPGIENEIVRAWQGELPAGAGEAMEIWCVEAEMRNEQDPAFEPAVLTWIVTRPDGGSDWTAAMLATMSASWWYEACE